MSNARQCFSVESLEKQNNLQHPESGISPCWGGGGSASLLAHGLSQHAASAPRRLWTFEAAEHAEGLWRPCWQDSGPSEDQEEALRAVDRSRLIGQHPQQEACRQWRAAGFLEPLSRCLAGVLVLREVVASLLFMQDSQKQHSNVPR